MNPWRQWRALARPCGRVGSFAGAKLLRRKLLAGVAGAAALAAVSPNPVAAQTLTEADAIARMRQEHPAVHALRFGVREVEADALERSLPVNPTVSYTREDAAGNRDDFLLVSQELPLRGRTGLFGAAAGRAAEAADAQADADLHDFEVSLRLAFADLLLAQERTVAIDAGLTELRRLVELLRVREQEGEGSRFDRQRAEREVADVEADLAIAGIGQAAAQARLAAFFAPGSNPDGLVAAGRLADLEAGAAAESLDTLLPRALEQRSDYRAFVSREARWAIERRAAERLRLPGAAVTAGLKRSGNALIGADAGYAVTATVGVPVFNRGQLQAARAEAARARLEAERHVLRGRIEQEVRVARTAAARYLGLAGEYRATSVEPAAELASIAQAAYEEGEYGVLELLDAHRVTLGATLRELELLAAAKRAVIELDRAAGEMTVP